MDKKQEPITFTDKKQEPLPLHIRNKSPLPFQRYEARAHDLDARPIWAVGRNCFIAPFCSQPLSARLRPNGAIHFRSLHPASWIGAEQVERFQDKSQVATVLSSAPA